MSDALLDRVRDQIARSMNGETPDVRIQTQARQLGMSPRSLQRRLGEKNTSWSELVDEVRRTTAMQLLLQRDLPLTQLAEQLGFSSVPTVYRAFRRWTGTSPRLYQKNVLKLDRVLDDEALVALDSEFPAAANAPATEPPPASATTTEPPPASATIAITETPAAAEASFA